MSDATAAASAARSKSHEARWQHRLQELQRLLQAGESTEAICAALEVTPRTLTRQLYRRGRGDLVGRLELWRWANGRPEHLVGKPAASRMVPP